MRFFSFLGVSLSLWLLFWCSPGFVVLFLRLNCAGLVIILRRALMDIAVRLAFLYFCSVISLYLARLLKYHVSSHECLGSGLVNSACSVFSMCPCVSRVNSSWHATWLAVGSVATSRA